MYKSVDGGKTWSHNRLDNTQHIAKIVVHPQNPDIVYVAALGHAYGPNEMRGVFRSNDGGKTWSKVLFKDNKTGAIDLVFDPNNPHILFAALWEAQRTPWSLTSGGPGSGLYRSGDDGATWKRLEGHGLPSGVLGRIGFRFRALTGLACTRSSKRKRAEFTGATMEGRTGNSSIRITVSRSAPGIFITFLPTRRAPIRCTC